MNINRLINEQNRSVRLIMRSVTSRQARLNPFIRDALLGGGSFSSNAGEDTQQFVYGDPNSKMSHDFAIGFPE